MVSMMTLLVADQSENESRLVIEASILGWRPGHWPKSFVIEEVATRFDYTKTTWDAEGDVVSCEYASQSGDMVVVLND